MFEQSKARINAVFKSKRVGPNGPPFFLLYSYAKIACARFENEGTKLYE